jgi:pimeloyl-ACP methyl ester carboxylesterase
MVWLDRALHDGSNSFPLCTPARRYRHAMDSSERTIPIDCGSIHVRWWGPSDPVETVVLLHGGPGMSERYMEPVVPFVDNGRRRIVSYDQRGTGQSRCDSDDPADFGLDAQAADLTRVIDSVAVGPVHLLGHSWGGIVAMDFAGRHGDRIASMIAVGSAPPNHADLEVAQASMTARIEELQERGLIVAELPEGGTEGLRAVLPMYFWDPTLAMPEAAVQALEVTSDVNARTWAAIEGFDLTESLRSYRGRALLIFGEADPIGLPASEATKAALANSRLRYEVLERCGHFPWFEAPDPFRAILDSFLSA